jgi:RNA polymerase sigma factor (TIGR02999 family)
MKRRRAGYDDADAVAAAGVAAAVAFAVGTSIGCVKLGSRPALGASRAANQSTATRSAAPSPAAIAPRSPRRARSMASRRAARSVFPRVSSLTRRRVHACSWGTMFAASRCVLDAGTSSSSAWHDVTPLVYNELRRLANHYLKGERKDHTLQGTALVHEAYIRLMGQGDLEWQNRAHFFGVAARLMRQILVDHARKHRAAKRGSGERDLSLEEAAIFSAERASSLVALDDALESLARVDERKSRLVELRYFGGLSIEEISEVEESSVATVKRHMRMAEAWLHKEMSKG